MNEAFKDLIPVLLASGQAVLAEKLQSIKPTSSLEQLALKMLVEVVSREGPAGVAIVSEKLDRLLSGDSSAVLDFADLELASDLLYAQEKAEAAHKSAAKDLVVRVGELAGPILAGVLKLAL